MKKYKATVGFCGIVSMYQGEVRELPEEIAAELLACGYIEEAETAKADKPKPKGGKKNDSKSTKR